MIKLRQIEEKDAPLMQEWMQDPDQNMYFRFSEEATRLENIKKFINNSFNEVNKNYAIVDEEDEYLGTISLKNIDLKDKNAEYAISLRKKSIGSGSSKEATKLVLNIAFKELGLHRVYLNVYSDNIRAIKFYEKSGFKFEGESIDCLIKNGKYRSLKWYAILNN